MGRYWALVLVVGLAMAPIDTAGAQAKKDKDAPVGSGPEVAAANLPPLPPLPTGTSTVVGGVIRSVDPVLDEIMLQVYGGHPMKIYFDARTQLFRDGVKTSPADLRASDRASIQTVLDGDDVYALSIHMLSRIPEGECQGQVLSYDPGSRMLTVSNTLSRQPLQLQVPAGTPLEGVGQAKVAGDNPAAVLQPGALLAIEFNADHHGGGVARKISLLAAPGSRFVFSGNVTFLDLAEGQMTLVDPRDGRSYSLTFDTARIPESRQVHIGSHVVVTTHFDGTRYVASAIEPN